MWAAGHCLSLPVDAVWKEHWRKTLEVWSIHGSGRSFAMDVFQKCSVPGLLVPLPPLPLFSKAVIFLVVALQRARCVLTSAGTCG